MKTRLKWLKKYITKNYGKKCKDFEISCYVCLKWLAYDILTDCLIDEGSYEK